MANWSEEIKRNVWNRCNTVPGKSADDYRLDEQGALIKWSDYGKYNDGGWQIDHIYPETPLQKMGVKQEKIDDIINLRALNSCNNDTKSDNYPDFESSIAYDPKKGKNVDKTGNWSVTKTKQMELKKFFGI